ncbi:exo-alpha-sialidase [Mixta calida]|uniref:tail fiber/spike domain-containing protein n=1 Tax=Mixta calida TaxID=665913 RepID=UPI002FDF07C1
MATQPTQNPVPSESPRDLKFNAGKIDEFVTSLALKYQDRFGTEHYTIEGLLQLAQEAIAAFGWITVDSFQDGATLKLPNQVLRDESTGEYYRWDGVLPKEVPPGSTPASTGGVGKGAWLSVGDAALREQLGQISLLRFKDVNAIFSGITSGGITVSLKAGDNVITDGGTIWEVTNANPSSLSDIAATSPYNVIDFGADKTGVNDSTDAFTSAAGCIVPAGTYRIESDLADTYYSDGEIIITGSGSVKLIPMGGKNINSLPVSIDNTTGGILYSDNLYTLPANSGEFLREPSLVHSTFNNAVFLVYTVLVGSKFDPGQDASQTSRIEIRRSLNSLTFESATILSTEGEQQASEPCIAFDHKRGRLWCFYTTARGKVGVGYGSVGYDPNHTFQNWVTYSDNYGTTWSEPENITTKVKPFNATSAWASPSPLCVTGDGDLIVPYAWTLNDHQFYHGYIRVTERADGTLKYSRHLIVAGGPEGSNGGAELQIAQLGDGSLLAMVRDYFNEEGKTKGRQRFFRSYDWVNWVLQSSLDTTNCKSGLSLYSSSAFGDSRNALIVTSPTGEANDNLIRANLKMWISSDNGETWTSYPNAIFDSLNYYVGYSSSVPLPSGGLLVASEAAQYNNIIVKHLALGAFTGVNTYSKRWGQLPYVGVNQRNALCANYDITQYGLFYCNESKTLQINDFGTPRQLSSSPVVVDVSSPTTFLNSRLGGIFYVSATMTLNAITGDASSILIISTKSSEPVTLQESTNTTIDQRIRVNKTLSASAIKLYRTPSGWWADSGA